MNWIKYKGLIPNVQENISSKQHYMYVFSLQIITFHNLLNHVKVIQLGIDLYQISQAV